MKTVTITITDTDDETGVAVRLEFGPDGIDEDSTAHHLAAACMSLMTSLREAGSPEPTFSRGH